MKSVRVVAWSLVSLWESEKVHQVKQVNKWPARPLVGFIYNSDFLFFQEYNDTKYANSSVCICFPHEAETSKTVNKNNSVQYLTSFVNIPYREWVQ